MPIRLFLFTFIFWCSPGSADSFLPGTYSGPESVTQGTCKLHVLKSNDLAAEVLFLVSSRRNDLIHMEVLTLTKSPAIAQGRLDFERTTELGRTILRDQTYYHFDYAVLQRTDAGPETEISFSRLGYSQGKGKSGPVYFDSRTIFKCPKLIKK